MRQGARKGLSGAGWMCAGIELKPESNGFD
jgi:hypothetical protein